MIRLNRTRVTLFHFHTQTTIHERGTFPPPPSSQRKINFLSFPYGEIDEQVIFK